MRFMNVYELYKCSIFDKGLQGAWVARIKCLQAWNIDYWPIKR